MFLGFGMITVLMLAILGYSYYNFTKQSADVELNLHTYNVIRETDTIIISLVNMETGARGFALTGDEEFLKPFNQGKTSYETHYNKIKQLTTDNYRQQDRLENLNNSYETWVQWENSQILDVRRKVTTGQANMADLIKTIRSGEGKAQMDESRTILDDIAKGEQELLITRQNQIAKMERQTAIMLSLGGLLATLVSIIISISVIRMVVDPIKTVTNTFKEISEGDADLEVRLNTSSNDELGDMGKYFNRFMARLKELIIENKNQSWLKTGQAELNEKMSGEQDILLLSTSVITYIAKYLNAQIGVVYIKTVYDTFELLGTYAYNTNGNPSNEIRVGEGIVGQAILEKQTIVITNVPEDYIKIGSGVGEASPRNILVTPFVYENEVIGVIELGSFHEFTDIQLNFLEVVSSSIASTVHSQEIRLKMKELLAKTMEQSEELQSQQEELRQNNEELEDQTKALMESESYLQNQQEELRVVNEELEERTKVLEKQKNDIFIKNEDLKRAQVQIQEKAKALEIASNYKSEFLANMSHELRTPLNSILVLSQMLAAKEDNTVLTAKQLEFANTIHSSGKDLLMIINDILDLSKVQAGKMDINFQKLNLSELAQYVDRTFKPVAMQKGLNFKVEIEDGLPKEIVSDSQRVQQIVNNLLSNAIKFTSNGEVTMTFHRVKNDGVLKSYHDIQDFIGVSITDTGIGIPFDKQSIIFEAFKQSDGTTSRKYGGTGLGLSISTELAYLLGGWIYVVSNEEVGSTFTLILPIEGDKQKVSSNEFIIKENVENLNTTQVQENILAKGEILESKIINDKNIDDRSVIKAFERFLLIIEDDKSFAKILMELAHEKGYKCLIAKDGVSALDLAMKYKPDAILLDIGLPDINGWKVVERLKENKDTENISVHVISGGEYSNSLEKMDSGARSTERFVSEVSLFLHDLDSKIEEKKIKIIKSEHEKEDVLNNKKVLVVDDDMRNIFALTSLLEEKGIEVVVGRTGIEGIKTLHENLDVDLILMDIMMTEMDGYKAMREIRRGQKFKKIPIIAITAKAMKDDKQKCIDAGADDYLTKPIDMNKLISLLRVWLYK